MIGFLMGLAQVRIAHDATERRIAALEVDMELHRRKFEEQRRAHDAADPRVIYVEARVVADASALPAPAELQEIVP